MRNKRTLYFRSSETMPADIYHIVDAAHDPEIAVFITSRAIAGKINSLDLRPVLFAIPSIITPDGTQHRRPGLLDDQVASFIWPNWFSVARHYVGVDSRERKGCGTGFSWSGAGKRCDHDGAGFSLPPGIHNRTTTLTN